MGLRTVCCSDSDGGVGGSSVPHCRPGCAPRVQAPHCSPAVARCVLAVLDDLHCTTSARRRSFDGRSHSSDGREIPRAATSRLLPFFDPFHVLRRHKSPSDDTASESSYDSASDYHLYEEILYEATTSSSSKPLEVLPPPLPARPPHLFRNVKPHQHHQSQENLVSAQNLRQHSNSKSHQKTLLASQRLQSSEVQSSQLKQTVVHHVQVSSPGTPTKPSDKSPPTQKLLQHQHTQQQQEPQQQPGEQQQHQTHQVHLQQNQNQTKPTPPPKPPKPPRTIQSPGKPSPPPKLMTSTSSITTVSSLPTTQPQQTYHGASLHKDHQPQPQQQQQQQQKQKAEEQSVLKPQTDKPKQRSNLYSIFRDRDHRRCLSASLQQEYQQDFQQEYLPEQQGSSAVKVATCAAVAGADDDYGFKVVPHVV